MTGHHGRVETARRFKMGRYGFVSDRGLNPRRVTNEDSFLLLESAPLFAVADGVGGQNAGEVASQVTVEILKHYFANKKLPEDKVKYLEQVIRHANRYLLEMSLDDELMSGMATTLAVVLLEKKQAILSHIGDSRIYRFVDGRLQRETTDHTVAEDQIHPPGGLGVNQNVITRALGIGGDVEPETTVIPILPETTFLLCTDGITRHISDEELAEILRHEDDPQPVCDRLKELCYERGAKDNLTAIVVKLEETSWLTATTARRRTPSPPLTEHRSAAGPTRIQVHLQGDAETIGSDEGITGLLEDSSAIAATFAGNLDRDLGVGGKYPSPRRRMLNWLLLGLALGVAFWSGAYTQHEYAPAFLANMMNMIGSVQTPAQRAFEDGRQAFENTNYPEALRHFSRAVEMSPETAVHYHWLARTQMAMKVYLVAAQNFTKAATLSGQPDEYLYAAAAYQALGDAAKASEAIGAYLSTRP